MRPGTDFYVYVKFRPWDGSPCYVGKGKGDRAFAHEYRAFNPHLANIIKKAGGELPTVFVREGLTERDAFELEVIFIKSIGRKANGGPLCNMTDGGDGSTGHTHAVTLEMRRKISKANLGRKRTAEMNLANSERGRGRPSPRKGTRLPEETKNRVSATLKRLGIKPPSRKGTTTPPEVRAKQSAGLVAYHERRRREQQGKSPDDPCGGNPLHNSGETRAYDEARPGVRSSGDVGGPGRPD